MNFKSIATTVAAGAIALSAVGMSTPAQAEYPNDKTVQMLVPFGAGGGTDRWARVFASSAFDVFEGGMRIQNRGGASGTVGWKHMLDKGADGYTVIMASPTPVLAALAEKKPPFDPGKDLKIVAYYSVMRTTLMVPKGNDYDSWDKFIAYLKAGKEKLTVGGTMTHVIGMMQALNQLGLADKIIPVVYSGTGKAMNDYVGGHIKTVALTTSTAVTMTDKHNAIFNASALEYPKGAVKVLGDVPNAKKLGMKPYSPPRFLAMHPDTPDEQVEAMSKKMGELVTQKPIVNLIKKLGEEIMFVPRAEAEKAYQEVIQVSRDNIKLMQ